MVADHQGRGDQGGVRKRKNRPGPVLPGLEGPPSRDRLHQRRDPAASGQHDLDQGIVGRRGLLRPFPQERTREGRAAELLDELAGWLAEGRIKPAITAKRPLEEAREALRDMADRKVLGKIVLTTELGRTAA